MIFFYLKYIHIVLYNIICQVSYNKSLLFIFLLYKKGEPELTDRFNLLINVKLRML